MSKIQINNVKLDGTELFNDSETFLNELQDSEMEEIFGGLSRVSPDESVITTVYIPEEPIHPRKPIHPREPIHPRKPIYPICWNPKPIYPIKPIDYPCPVIL